MTKIFEILLTVIWWLWIVISTTGISILIGLTAGHFIFASHYYFIGAVFAVIGMSLGIAWAEKIRTKNGFDKFYGAATGAPTKDQNMQRENY